MSKNLIDLQLDRQNILSNPFKKIQEEIKKFLYLEMEEKSLFWNKV